MRYSIRYQLILPLLALMLGLVAASTWNAWASGERARRQVEKQIDDIAATVNASSFPLTPQTLQLMKGLSGADFLICDEERRPLRDGQGALIATIAGVPDSLPAPSVSPTQQFDSSVKVGDTDYRCGGLFLRQSARPEAILYILYPESLMSEAVWESLRPALTVGLGGGTVSLLLTVLLAQRLGRRVQELERRTRLIAEGDFSEMKLPRRNDELRDLGRSINEMARQLADFQAAIQQSERLRLLGQIGGGLAHQLRNGVAGARLAVQLHLQDSPGLDAESLRIGLRQLSLVEMHLKRFLELGKAMELEFQPCELEALLTDTLDLVGPQCRHNHVDLRVLPAPAAVQVAGDPGQLGQVFLNLITNAVEAARPNGWVEVRWGKAGERAFVEVRDSGAGPPADVANRLFEPFVSGKREGVGLGLAVARQITQAHGGVISWSRASDATCFRVELRAP